MSKGKITWIGACLVASLLLGFYLEQNSTKEEQSDNFIPTEATIIQVFPARISRFGVKPPRYGLSFTALDGNTYVQYNCELGGVHKLNDKVRIFYNSQNPDEPVLDKIE